MQKTIDSASYVHQIVRAALTVVVKGHDPVKEEGKKKLTASDGVANEGAQDDQAFAVAFGPDNYDKLTKDIIAAPYRQAYNAAGTILKALENKQFNFPGNIEDALKKAHAAVHGREMWDARYGDVCDLLTQARKILHSIEKTAEVSQGGSGMMVVGKADPGQEEKAGESIDDPAGEYQQTMRRPPPQPKKPKKLTFGGSLGEQERESSEYKARRAVRKDTRPGHPSGETVRVGARGQQLTSVPHTAAHSREAFAGPPYNMPPKKPAQEKAMRKAVQKAIKAVRGR